MEETKPKRKYRSKKQLTPLNLMVLNCFRQGMSNQQIADTLCVEEKTIKWHLTHIYACLGYVPKRGQHSGRKLMANLINLQLAPHEVVTAYYDGTKCVLVAAPPTVKVGEFEISTMHMIGERIGKLL